MTAEDYATIYDDLMRLKPDGMTPNAWAVVAGVSRTVWADMRRHGNPSRRTLEKLLAAAGSSLAEFEALRISGASSANSTAASGFADRHASWGLRPMGPLPLIATGPGGVWDREHGAIALTELRTQEIAGSVPRPASLANDPSAYGVKVVGDSMWPRFRPGRVIAISPRGLVSIGDDVAVKLKSNGAVVPTLIKELVRKNDAEIELRQFNPDLTFRVPASAIAAVEKVLGEIV